MYDSHNETQYNLRRLALPRCDGALRPYLLENKDLR